MSTLLLLQQQSARTNSAVPVRKGASTSRTKRTNALCPQPLDEAGPRLVVTGTAPIQTKLEVSQPGDPLEQEADRVAAQVMRMPPAIGATSADVPNSPDSAQPSVEQEALQREAEPTEEAGRAASQLERAIRKFVPTASRVASALEYIPLVATRVAQGVRQWALTGALPENIPPELRTQITGGGDIGQMIASAAICSEHRPRRGASTRRRGSRNAHARAWGTRVCTG